MLGTRLHDRYSIEAELGRGAVGIVYRAYDTLLERPVAIKFLTNAQLGSQGRARLLHEAQTAARLNHPNIISIYDAGEVQDAAFIIMELLDGNSLYTYKPNTQAEILEVGRQICLALEHAHQHGIVHRDLKPENVIRNSQGKIKLTDFGLARSIASRISIEGAIIGTVFYIAPEQALGKDIDGRADLYSLGIMFYELLTGKLPFSSDDPLAVITQHLYAPAVPPSSYNPAVLPGLEALTLRLMEKQPEDRPSNATIVRQIIDQLLHDQGRPPAVSYAIPSSLQVSPLDLLARGRLVGRERELSESRNIWKQIISGSSETHVLLVSGEAGVGKTPLVREIIALAEVSGGRAFQSQCYPDGNAPYSPIAPIVRQSMPIDLPPRVLADLIRLAPDLQTAYPDVIPNPELDPISEQTRLFESMVSLCLLLGKQKPLLLVLEDVQWADLSTLMLLRHLARRSRTIQPNLSLLVLMTYRETELDETNPLNEFLIDLTLERLAKRLKLNRFDRDQTRQFLSVLLQTEVEPNFLEVIYRETEGNQFYIEEVCRALIEENQLFHDQAGWHQPNNMDKIHIPQSIRLAIQSRINKLPTETQETLRLAAVIGREFDYDILRQASEQDEEVLIASLETAEHNQLIQEEKHAAQEKFTFSHGLTMSTLRESVSGLRRRRLHRRVAEAIELYRPDNYESLAYHYEQAGDEEQAWVNYRKAGERAQKIYANHQAAHLYSQALALSPTNLAERFDVLAARASVYDLLAKRNEQQEDVEALLTLSEKMNDDMRRCDALLAQAAFAANFDYTRANQAAEGAVALSHKLNDTSREGQALRELAKLAHYAGNHSMARYYAEAAADRFAQAGQPIEEAASLHLLSLVLSELYETEPALHTVERALELSRKSRDRRQESISLRRLAIVYENQEKFDQALPLAEEALALHREIGDRVQECHALNNLGILMSHLQRHDESEKYLEQALNLAWETLSGEAIQYAAGNLVALHYHRKGMYQAALTFLDTQIACMRNTGMGFAADYLLTNKLGSLFELGQYTQALQLIDTISPLAGQIASPSLDVRILATTGLLQAELGDFQKGFDILEQAMALAPGTGNPLDLAIVLSNQALACLLEGGDENLKVGLENSEKALAIYQSNYAMKKTELMVDTLATQAAIQLNLGQASAALNASEKAVQSLQTCAEIVNPERILYLHARNLYADNREIEGNNTLRRAWDRIQLVISLTSDKELQRSFIENVRLNHDILAEAKQRCLTN